MIQSDKLVGNNRGKQAFGQYEVGYNQENSNLILYRSLGIVLWSTRRKKQTILVGPALIPHRDRHVPWIGWIFSMGMCDVSLHVLSESKVMNNSAMTAMPMKTYFHFQGSSRRISLSRHRARSHVYHSNLPGLFLSQIYMFLVSVLETWSVRQLSQRCYSTHVIVATSWVLLNVDSINNKTYISMAGRKHD